MLPNLLIIGGMKCGTTSLHYYLQQHPQIFMSRIKELNYFHAARNWSRGRAWYEAQFPVDRPVRGESSPYYTDFPVDPGIPARMRDLVPQAKLIYLVRDPVQRIISQYVHHVAINREHRPFAEACGAPPYLNHSRYARQLEHYLAHFPRAQILVVPAESLRTDRLATLRDIFQFLGVAPDFVSPRFTCERLRARDQRRATILGRWAAPLRQWQWLHALPPDLRWRLVNLPYWPFSEPMPVPELTPATRDRLHTELAPDARRLREITGRDFPGWCV